MQTTNLTPALQRSREAEGFVAQQLEAQGWRILSKNFRILGSELDIVARKGGTLAIIEVKARKTKPLTLSDWQSLISTRKKEALYRGGVAFHSRFGADATTVRFDLALVWGSQRPYHIEYLVNILCD